MFSCDLCKYQTNKKWNYQKHCESKRHQKNLEKSITNSNKSITNSNKSITNSNKSITNSNKYKCIHCNSEFKRIDNYNKHLNKCSNRLLNLLKEKDNEINTLKKENKQLVDNQKEEINALTNELNDALKLVQEYQLKIKDTEIKVKDTEIRCLKEMNQINISNSNSNNNNRTNITQFIINKYPNAKNVWIPDKVSGLENFASDKVEENVNKLLTNIYKRNIKPEERPIWCIDSARNKYLTRLDNLWQVDLYGLLFCEKVCRQLANRCSEYITGEGLEKLNEHDRIRSLTMITDLLGRKRLSGPIKGQFIVNSLEDEEESLQ